MSDPEITLRVIADTSEALAALAEVRAKVDELNAALAALAEKGVTIPLRAVAPAPTAVGASIIDQFVAMMNPNAREV